MNDFIHQPEIDVNDLRVVARESNDPYLLAIVNDLPQWADTLISRDWYRELVDSGDCPSWDTIWDPMTIDGVQYLPVA